jgi:hypothetical protein
LPTPSASDSTGGESKEDRIERGNVSGPGLRDLPKLLPTPVVQHSARRSTARTEDWKSNTGTTLTDAIWETQGRTTDTQGKLLPTPTTQPATGNGHARNLSKEAKMLPTPMANPENPGAGGELRAAIVHGEERRNETGVDTMGRPNLGRPPTGEPTPPPSGAGKSSRGQHPDQLTIEDA